MGRTILAALILAAWSPPLLAQIGGMSPQQLRQLRDRLIRERQGVESSGGFQRFWSDGDKWLRKARQAGGGSLSQTAPSVELVGIHAETIDELIPKLGDRKLAVRKDARAKLIQIGAPAAAALVKVLTEKKSKLKPSVKVTLDKMGSPAFAALLPLLEHEDSSVRRDALSVLRKIFQPEHIGPLIGIYKRTSHRDVKTSLKTTFFRGMRGKDMAPMLQVFRSEKDPGLRLIALSILAAQGGIDVLPLLLSAATPANRRDRGAVALANGARKAIAIVVFRILDKKDVPKLFAVYRAAPPAVQAIIRPKLKSLASEDPNDARNYKFFFYVRQKNIRPKAGGGWPRRI